MLLFVTCKNNEQVGQNQTLSSCSRSPIFGSVQNLKTDRMYKSTKLKKKIKNCFTKSGKK